MRRTLTHLLLGTVLAAAIFLPQAPAHATKFAPVPKESTLYTHLSTLRNSSWIRSFDTIASDTKEPLTRYEIALETAKTLIFVRARSQSDQKWEHSATIAELRSLQMLTRMLKAELAEFDIDVDETLLFLNDLIVKAQEPQLKLKATEPREREEAASVSFSRFENEETIASLSQRWRIYSALDSLEQQSRDPMGVSTDEIDIFSVQPGNTLSPESNAQVKRLRAGTAFNFSDSFRLRADYGHEKNVDNVGLREFLSSSANSPMTQSARTLEAGADWSPRPGLTFSGGIAHIDSEDPTQDGIRFQGGIGLTAWQNRVALSAHLSRLVPEDSLALSQSAARLNLGVGITSQLQLKLMYQQLFGEGELGRENRRFGGSIDFSF